MINIGFVNLILIIVDNVFGSKESGNLYFFALGMPNSPRFSVSIAPDSLRFFTPIVSGNPYSSTYTMSNSSGLSTFFESFNLNNSIANLFTNILINLFGNFNIDGSSDLAVDLIPSFAIPFFSDLPIFGRFSQDNFPTLAVNAFFILGQDIFPNHLPNFCCLLLLFFAFPSNSTAFFV